MKGWPGYGGRGDWNVFHKPNPYAVEKWMHTVFNSVSKLLSCKGGKFTTYRYRKVASCFWQTKLADLLVVGTVSQVDLESICARLFMI